MSNIYNSQLDAFDLYHIIREIAEEEYTRAHGGGQLPPAGHAAAGAIASALSNSITYPLDLIITRLQTQQRLQKESAEDRQVQYKNLADAAVKIYTQEGNLSGFYVGLLQDTAKTVLDSFLFFLLYSFLRERRLARFAKTHNGRKPSLLPAFDELSIGFMAGSLTRLVTTPISNVVTRKQTSTMAASRRPKPGQPISAEKEGPEHPKQPLRVPSTRDIIREIHAQRGITGFWSGYSASLILTLNPSLTFFLFEALKRVVVPRAKRDNPPASATFLLAAVSKGIASSVTYPFQLAKARMQAAGEYSSQKTSKNSSRSSHSTIIHTVLSIASSEGISSLYEGLSSEILKGFLTHGLTMLFKQGIHNTVLQLYLSLSNLLRSLGYSISGSKSRSKITIQRLRQEAKNRNKEYYDMAIDRVGAAAETAADGVERLRNNVSTVSQSGVSSALEESGTLMQEVMEMANETAELIRDYVDDDGGDDS